MGQCADILEKRLQAIESSDSDTDFYKHIHAYIKFLLTTPKLKAILDEEERNFYRKVKFTKDNLKLERSNFHQAYFVTSYVRIYWPIEEYQNSPEPDEDQDPLALLLLYGMKHPRTLKWVNKYPIRQMKKERLKELKSYSYWFEGHRHEYIREIKNLHLEILTALSKQETSSTPVIEKNTLSLHLDFETGDFHYGHITDSLNIKTQGFRVLAKLVVADGRTV